MNNLEHLILEYVNENNLIDKRKIARDIVGQYCGKIAIMRGVVCKNNCSDCVEDSEEWLLEEHSEKQIDDNCSNCKYTHKDEYEMPCLICKRSKKDMWERSEEKI